MDAREIFEELGVTGSAYAAPIAGTGSGAVPGGVERENEARTTGVSGLGEGRARGRAPSAFDGGESAPPAGASVSGAGASRAGNSETRASGTGAGREHGAAAFGGVGVEADRPMSPASVAKVQVALAVEDAIAAGTLDGREQRILAADRRTPGPTGISLSRDEVRMSVRDLVVQMLTISDNVATDELLTLVGVRRVNELTARLGMRGTRITGDLRSVLDDMAREAGFGGYPALAAHDPAAGPSPAEVRQSLHTSAALDPARGWATTAADTVTLLRAIWTDTAAAPAACANVREAMSRQLTRHRIAAGFGPEVAVAAKSGGLMGLVRNEAAVVTFPGAARYAVAVFTRSTPDTPTDPARIDAGIGRVARALIDRLRADTGAGGAERA